MKPQINVGWTAFWGVFPDLFAFGIPTIISLVVFLKGGIPYADISHHGIPGSLGLVDVLYNNSHSLIVFGVVR